MLMGMALVLCTLSISRVCLAEDHHQITFISSGSIPAHDKVIQQTIKQLRLPPGKTQTIKLSSASQTPAPALRSDPGLIVAVGAQATIYACREFNTTPILATLIPKVTFEKILTDTQKAPDQVGAIYLDQPPVRQLAAIKALLPQLEPIGILLGPNSKGMLNAYTDAARQLGVEIHAQAVEDNHNTFRQLDTVLSESKALLTLPAPSVINAKSIKSIFLKSYQRNIPIIGFSEGFTKAGATFSIHSSPNEIARHLTEFIADVLAQPKKSLPRDYPKFYSLSVNQKVARSLSLKIHNDQAARDKIDALERGLD